MLLAIAMREYLYIIRYAVMAIYGRRAIHTRFLMAQEPADCGCRADADGIIKMRARFLHAVHFLHEPGHDVPIYHESHRLPALRLPAAFPHVKSVTAFFLRPGGPSATSHAIAASLMHALMPHANYRSTGFFI